VENPLGPNAISFAAFAGKRELEELNGDNSDDV